MPPWSPCGFAVDLLRSCYESEVRFYQDIEDTVRVRWYFVPKGTPFIPYRNNWVSMNWDSDPKPAYHLGEQPEYGRAWVNGTAVGSAPGLHVCGTEEQWRFGQALPPSSPVPVGPDGTPLCCFLGGVFPVPPPLPPALGLVIHLRPEELQDLADSDPVTYWPAAEGSSTAAIAEPESGAVVWNAAGGNGLGSVHATADAYMIFDPPRSIENEVDVFAVCLHTFTGIPNFFVNYCGAPNSSVSKCEAGRTGMQFIAGAFVASPFSGTLASGLLRILRWRGGSPGMVYSVDGADVFTGAPAALMSAEVTLRQRISGLPTRDLAELLVYDRVLTTAEAADVVAYLADRYGITV